LYGRKTLESGRIRQIVYKYGASPTDRSTDFIIPMHHFQRFIPQVHRLWLTRSKRIKTKGKIVGITADVGISRALFSDQQCHFYRSFGSVPEAFYTGISTVLSVSPVLCN
jgi:hypothetical protein